MKRLIILIFLLMPLTVFAQGTMRDYPVNDNPNTANDTLLGIDEQQDVANWAVNNFSFSGILNWIKANSGEYLEAAADFTTSNEVIVSTGSGKNTQRTPVQIDSSGNVVNVTAIGMLPITNPEWCFKDSDNPSADQCSAYVAGNYRSGAAANDFGDLIFYSKVAGSKAELGRFNSLNLQWEFPTYHIAVPDDAYDAGTWNGNTTVPTKNAVRDQLEIIATGGEVNDLVSQGTGEEIRISKVGSNINVKDILAGADINVSTDGNNNIVVANTAPGGVTTGGNLGTGANVYRDKTTNTLNFRSIVGLGRLSAAVSGNNAEIELSTTGEANDLSSVGTGGSLRSGKSGENLQIKSLRAGANITIDCTVNANQECEIGSTTAPGEANTISTTTPGTADLVATPSKVGEDLRLKSLVQGTNITITQTSDQVTINAATGSGEANDGTNVGVGDGEIYAGKSGLNIEFKRVAAGVGISIVNNLQDVEITNSLPENTSASNVGGQTGEVFAGETGDNLEFKTVGASNGISVANNAQDLQVTGVNAAADNTTKGVAAFDPNDFNSAAGVISFDYANGQKATTAQPGLVAGMATSAEIEAGVVSDKAIAPDQFAASIYSRRDIGFNVIDSDQAAAVGMLVAGYSVPLDYGNHKYRSLTCSVWDAGVDGSMTIQAIKRRNGVNTNLMSAALTISTEYSVSQYLPSGNIGLNSGDILTIEILTIHTTTPANGVHCTIQIEPDI